MNPIWKEDHPRIKDPLKKMYVHVGMVMALMITMLALSFVYLDAPAEPETAGMVLVEYPDFGVTEAWSSFVDIVKYSPNHGFIMITLYTLWIVIFGVGAVLVHEYKK